MPVLITHNLNTENDITNGARGVVTNIIFEATEASTSRTQSTVYLRHLPFCVLVKLDHSGAPRFADEDDHVIPIFPFKKSFRISIIEHGKKVTRTVSRKQLPVAAAYALTDYRAQGQTIPAAIVDLASPPTGKLNLFNIYVALSRCKGRETIRLLRDFDENTFLSPQIPQLAAEDDRLVSLNKKTLQWWQQQSNSL